MSLNWRGQLSLRGPLLPENRPSALGLHPCACCTVLYAAWKNIPSSSHGTGVRLYVADEEVTETRGIVIVDHGNPIVSCRVGVVLGTPLWVESPGSKRTCPPLDNTAKPRIHPNPTRRLDRRLTPRAPNDTLPQSPAQLLPAPAFQLLPGVPHDQRSTPRPRASTSTCRDAVEGKSQATGHYGCPIRPPPAISSSISSSPLLVVFPVLCCLVPHRALFPLTVVYFSLLIQDFVSHTHTIPPFSLLVFRSKPSERSDEPKAQPQQPNRPSEPN
jgi:hypothetical protein